MSEVHEWRYALQVLTLEILSILEDEGVEKEVAE